MDEHSARDHRRSREQTDSGPIKEQIDHKVTLIRYHTNSAITMSIVLTETLEQRKGGCGD